jgi:hypothetical protein
VVRRFISLERCGLSIRNTEAHADRPTPLAPLLALPGASPIHARLRASLAKLDEGEFTEGHESDRKWKVAKEMVGRRLAQAEAKRLLAKFA